MYIYIYIYVYIYVSIHIYIYICIGALQERHPAGPRGGVQRLHDGAGDLQLLLLVLLSL